MNGEDQRRLDGILADHLDPSWTPGMSAAVTDATQTRAAGAVGVRRIDRPDPLTVDDAMHIGSCTKAMTAAYLGTAVDDGRVGWDDPVGEVLGITVHPHRAAVSLADLCAHLGGIQPLEEDEQIDLLPELPNEPMAQRRKLAELLLTEEPVVPIGEHSYSNGGFAVAVSVAESLGAPPWEHWMTGLFDTLAMDAGFGWPEHAWGHHTNDGRMEPLDPSSDDRFPAWLAVAGNVHATPEAMARWLRANLAGLGGDDALLAPATWKRIHTRHGERAGLGWGIQEFGGHAVSVHSGSAETFYTLVLVDRDRSLGFVVNANSWNDDAERICLEVLKACVTGFD